MSDIQLVYLSEATRAFAENEIVALVQQAQANNAKLSITGVMLYGHERFIQVLEGPLHAVNNLYTTIQADPRHRHVRQLSVVPIKSRQFPTWQMNLITLGKHRKLDIPALKRVTALFAERSIYDTDNMGKQATDLVEEFVRQMGDPNRTLTDPAEGESSVRLD